MWYEDDIVSVVERFEAIESGEEIEDLDYNAFCE